MAATRRPFTDDEIVYCCHWLALNNHTGQHRNGNKIWADLIDDVDAEPWTCKHTMQAWRDKYVKNSAEWDKRIAVLVKQRNIEPEKRFSKQDVERLVEYFKNANIPPWHRLYLETYTDFLADKSIPGNDRHSPKTWRSLYMRHHAYIDRACRVETNARVPRSSQLKQTRTSKRPRPTQEPATEQPAKRRKVADTNPPTQTTSTQRTAVVGNEAQPKQPPSQRQLPTPEISEISASISRPADAQPADAPQVVEPTTNSETPLSPTPAAERPPMYKKPSYPYIKPIDDDDFFGSPKQASSQLLETTRKVVGIGAHKRVLEKDTAIRTVRSRFGISMVSPSKSIRDDDDDSEDEEQEEEQEVARTVLEPVVTKPKKTAPVVIEELDSSTEEEVQAEPQPAREVDPNDDIDFDIGLDMEMDEVVQDKALSGDEEIEEIDDEDEEDEDEDGDGLPEPEPQQVNKAPVATRSISVIELSTPEYIPPPPPLPRRRSVKFLARERHITPTPFGEYDAGLQLAPSTSLPPSSVLRSDIGTPLHYLHQPQEIVVSSASKASGKGLTRKRTTPLTQTHQSRPSSGRTAPPGIPVPVLESSPVRPERQHRARHSSNVPTEIDQNEIQDEADINLPPTINFRDQTKDAEWIRQERRPRRSLLLQTPTEKRRAPDVDIEELRKSSPPRLSATPSRPRHSAQREATLELEDSQEEAQEEEEEQPAEDDSDYESPVEGEFETQRSPEEEEQDMQDRTSTMSSDDKNIIRQFVEENMVQEGQPCYSWVNKRTRQPKRSDAWMLWNGLTIYFDQLAKRLDSTNDIVWKTWAQLGSIERTSSTILGANAARDRHIRHEIQAAEDERKAVLRKRWNHSVGWEEGASIDVAEVGKSAASRSRSRVTSRKSSRRTSRRFGAVGGEHGMVPPFVPRELVEALHAVPNRQEEEEEEEVQDVEQEERDVQASVGKTPQSRKSWTSVNPFVIPVPTSTDRVTRGRRA